MIKKLTALLIVLSLVAANPYAEAAEKNIVNVTSFKGLDRNPNADRIADGAFTRFDNAYIKNGNINSVKGRDRLNSTALTNTTTNGLWYYENSAGSTKKILRMENTVLASYATDGTGRTSLNTGLTNEPHDAVQIGDTLYITSDTDGLYKWTGSGAATAITGISVPGNFGFTASSNVGGMTPGGDAIVEPIYTTSSVSSTESFRRDGGACVIGPATYAHVADSTQSGNSSCGGLNTNWIKSCATSAAYSYVYTKYNNLTGAESAAGNVQTASLSGANSVGLARGTGFINKYSNTTCTNSSSTIFLENAVTLLGNDRQTSTFSNIGSAPVAPFNSWRVYRTPANGSAYFLVAEQASGTINDGKPDSSLGVPLDTSISTVTPPSYRYIEEYKGSVFLAQNDQITYSHYPVGSYTDNDTYWLSKDIITTGAKKPVTGLHKTSDSLLIFTSDRIMELTGYGVSTFKMKPIVEGIGTVSDDTIETDGQGDVIFFAGTQGVYKVRTFSQLTDNLTGAQVDQPRIRLVKISSPNMDEVFRGTDSQIVLTPSDYATSHAYYDKDNDLYFLYIGNECFIFDNLNNVWSHIPATKMSQSLYYKSPSSAGQGVLVDSYGFLFNNWTGYENGIESGSVTGSITASTSTTLTCGGCSFNTTNDGLKGLWIGVLNDTDGIQYRQISSNTATAITVSSAWTTNPITTDEFYVAYIIPELYTKIYSFGNAPSKISTNEFWLTYVRTAAAQTIYVYSFVNKDTVATNALSTDMSLNGVVKFSMPMNDYWMQWAFRTYIYNTSNSITPPLNLISYSIRGETVPVS